MTRKFNFLLASVSAMVVAACAAHSPSAQAQDLDDPSIIAIYSQVNSFDIETALLGQVKGASQRVRDLGAMVSKDHSGVRQSIHELAKEIGVEPTLPPSRIAAARVHDEAIMSLRSLEGEAFDAAYLQHEINFHRGAIAAVESLLLPEAENAELRAHFEAILPAFQHHLEANIQAAESLGVPVKE